MKAKSLYRILAFSGLMSLNLISLSAQRPGIECGCKKYGNYVEPASKGFTVEQGSSVKEGSSSKGKYILEVDDGITQNEVNLTIYYQGILIMNENNMASGWAFSPDSKDATFVHAYLSDVDKYTLVVKNLKTPANEYIEFSSNNQGEAR